MKQLPVSVIVVSRGRPESLRLCLIGLARLHHRNYEVIVVADPAGIAAAEKLPFAEYLRLFPFDRPNISAARNVGIAAAGGDIVAFIDDDAVPEPAWLAHLEQPFRDPDVAAAGGFVIGRNGISWQWTARSIGPAGEVAPLQVDKALPSVLLPPPGRAIKTEGTNMALRRRVLLALGGFDETFRFYLDETDLNLRLAAKGCKTAIVPLAVVHHAYAPSSRRRQDRAVLDLFDIGRSSAYFWRKHLPETAHSAARDSLIQEQRQRIMRQLRQGALKSPEARHALQSLYDGLNDGAGVTPKTQSQIPCPENRFLSFPTQATGQAVTLSGGVFAAPGLLAKAKRLAAQGCTVSVYILSRTALYHKVAFSEDGYWLQKGGVYGKSTRSDPLVRLTTRANRVAQEDRRVAAMRCVPSIPSKNSKDCP